MTDEGKNYKKLLNEIIEQQKVAPLTFEEISKQYEESLVIFTPQEREEILKTAQRLFDGYNK